MKISIISAGATGLAAAAYLHLISVPFTLYVRNEEKRKLWETHPLNVSGKVNTCPWRAHSKKPARPTSFLSSRARAIMRLSPRK